MLRIGSVIVPLPLQHRLYQQPCTAVSATYARVRAAEIIADARAGKNPAERRSRAPTMRDLGKRFLKEYVPDHCKASTAEEYRRSIELFIDPRIGKLRVRDVQRSDIAALHHDMRDWSSTRMSTFAPARSAASTVASAS